MKNLRDLYGTCWDGDVFPTECFFAAPGDNDICHSLSPVRIDQFDREESKTMED